MVKLPFDALETASSEEKPTSEKSPLTAVVPLPSPPPGWSPPPGPPLPWGWLLSLEDELESLESEEFDELVESVTGWKSSVAASPTVSV